MQPLEDLGIECHFIVGNHDVSYKNTNEVNSLDEVVRGYKNFHIYTSPTEVNIKGLDILLLPWVCEQNYKETVKMIESTKAQVCFGHLSINGFEMHRGSIREGSELEDFDKKTFSKFDVVASGHFHHQSMVDNIKYLGAMYELTWADFNDPRGFHLFDTQNREFTFYQNPYNMFHMVSYDDVDKMDKLKEYIEESDFSHLENCYVKVVVTKRTNPYMFDLFMDKLFKFSPADISVVEDVSALLGTEDILDIEQAEDTITIISKYVDGLELSLEKDRMKSMMKSIYQEAIVLEDL